MMNMKLLAVVTPPYIYQNPTCSEDFTLEESMCHIISFEILKNTMGLFLVWPLRGFFLAFQLGLLEFGFSLLVPHYFLEKSVLDTLSHLSLILTSL